MPDPGEPGVTRTTLPVVSFVFEAGGPTYRYLTALVVQLADDAWEQRDLDVNDWIVLGPGEPVGTGYLGRIRKYLEPGWTGGRPVDRGQVS